MLANVCNCPSVAIWARRPSPANHWGTKWSSMECVYVCVCVTAFLISASQTGVNMVTGTINQYCVAGELAEGKAWKHGYTNVSPAEQTGGGSTKPLWQFYKFVWPSFSLFTQSYRHFPVWKSVRWRAYRGLFQNTKSTRWILMLDELITHTNLLPFLWTLAHKCFMNSFLGLKSSNCDPVKGSES